jgi:hypothetical protein
MKKIVIYFLLIILSVSCKKDSSVEPDSILYQNLDPSIKMSTVRYYTIEDHSVCTANIPIPMDSSVSFDIDIDSDKINDFRIYVSHNKWESTQYCGHCSIFEYTIQITGLNPTDSISETPQYSRFPKWYDTTSIVSLKDYWDNVVYLSMQGGCTRPTVNLLDSYIGIRHKNKFGWIHIAPENNNGIEIKELAINLTDNKTIKAGQKK